MTQDDVRRDTEARAIYRGAEANAVDPLALGLGLTDVTRAIDKTWMGCATPDPKPGPTGRRQAWLAIEVDPRPTLLSLPWIAPFATRYGCEQTMNIYKLVVEPSALCSVVSSRPDIMSHRRHDATHARGDNLAFENTYGMTIHKLDAHRSQNQNDDVRRSAGPSPAHERAEMRLDLGFEWIAMRSYATDSGRRVARALGVATGGQTLSGFPINEGS